MNARGKFMNERGAAMVELALLAPILLMLSLGAVDVGRVVLAHLSLEEAAQEGALFASYHGGVLSDTATQIVDAVVMSTDAISIDPAAVVVVCLGKAGGDQLAGFATVEVTASHNVVPLTPFLSVFLPTGIPVSARASGTVFTANCLATP